MNNITKKPLAALGYDFIPPEFIPKGKDEYHLRNLQHRSPHRFRQLKPAEIKILERNANSAGDWSMILVADPFNPSLIRNCTFYGLVRIGRQEPCFAEFNNLRMPVGLYNSTIISCDIGDNVVIDNVNFMSHYIIGNEVMLVNINELATTNHSKFGNGVLKEGEKENVRVWMEICNENAGRSVLPFNGMLTGDAWLWSRYRDDDQLLARFREFTDRRFDTQRGYYGKVGDRTVIKNSRIIKDAWIGSDAYIKGANKLKNLTINSGPDAKSQIGEGVELVNGIIGFGCRIFYGVKAVRFMMGAQSQLKYGARLINSYLGENSTISCCEVLNSLIFPAHEQHHNNSFLCAATVLGQSNMAAGATIGSNHNSRGADGELIAGRGFWPGLCVSLKHNSKFASFTIIAKGDFPAELNIRLPFSLVSNDVSADRLVIMPGYWFFHNMYALARNASKYVSRDKRIDRSLEIEYDFLAPDSINEIVASIDLLAIAVAKAWAGKNKKTIPASKLLAKGKQLLEKNRNEVTKLELLADEFENSRRPVVLLKGVEAYELFRQLIEYYAAVQLIDHIERKKIRSWEKLLRSLPVSPVVQEWTNIGGQLIRTKQVQQLLQAIHKGRVDNWDDVHRFYQEQSQVYQKEKFVHALAAWQTVFNVQGKAYTQKALLALLNKAIVTREWMTKQIYASREKDYTNPYRKMVYETQAEMDKVLGRLKDNPFIAQQQEETIAFSARVRSIINQLTD